MWTYLNIFWMCLSAGPDEHIKTYNIVKWDMSLVQTCLFVGLVLYLNMLRYDFWSLPTVRHCTAASEMVQELATVNQGEYERRSE